VRVLATIVCLSVRVCVCLSVTCNPLMDRQIEECSYNFAAGSFHTKKLCSWLFSTEIEIYWKK